MMTTESGRVAEATGLSQAEPVSRLGPAGFDPSREERLGRAILSVWHQARCNHIRYSTTGSLENDIRFFALGIAGEAGELANFVKKRWRDGDSHEEAIRFEIADVLAYAFMLADRLGVTPEELILTISHKQFVFINKMAGRDSDRSGEAIETAQTGSTSGESAGRQASPETTPITPSLSGETK